MGTSGAFMLMMLQTADELITKRPIPPSKSFRRVAFDHVGRDLNSHANALAALGAMCNANHGSRTIVLGEVPSPSFEEIPESVMTITLVVSWIDPISYYLKDDILSADPKEAHKIRCQSASYYVDDFGCIYRRSFTGPDL